MTGRDGLLVLLALALLTVWHHRREGCCEP